MSPAVITLWDNGTSEAAQGGNPERPLTHPLDYGEEGLAMKATRTCTIDGCQKPVLARGWCSAHWTRWKRHGDPLGGGVERNPLPDECTADGCTGKPLARGLCAMHWRRDKGDADPQWRERFLAKRREWHADNPERVAETRRRSRERNLETALARSAQWRAENRDQVLVNNWIKRRRDHDLSDDVVEVVHPDVVFDRDGGICQLCHELVDPELPWPDPMSATVDHVVPVIDPASTHSYANTQLAHWDCNRRKNAQGGA